MELLKMRKWLLIFLFLTYLLLCPYPLMGRYFLPPCVVTQVKSGTHLLKLIIEPMIHKSPIQPLPSNCTGPVFASYLNRNFSPKRSFLIFHTGSVRDIEIYLSRYPRSKKILLVRHLKDMVVSAKNYMTNRGFNFLPYFERCLKIRHPHMTYQKWLKLSEQQKLIETLYYFSSTKDENHRSFVLDHIVEDTIWFKLQYPDALILRFEDLFVNDTTLSLKTLNKIAQFLGCSLSHAQLQNIRKHAFGNSLKSPTFNPGKKINKSEKAFDSETQSLFDLFFEDAEEKFNAHFYPKSR